MRLSDVHFLPFCALIAGLLLAGCQGQNTSETAEASGPPPLPDGELAVENPWVRPAPAGSSSVLYMTIANGRSTADTLVDADAPIFGEVQMLGMASDTAGMATPDVPLSVPAQQRVSLEPEGRRVVLSGLQQALNEGDNLVLNLEFAQSGLQRIRAPVRTSPPSDQ